MRELAIATANSREQKVWNNRTVTFEALRERLKKCLYTSETVSEYAQMKKQERDKAKDHGGFVGGFLEECSRRKEKVKYRSLLSFDGDHITTDFLKQFETSFPYAFVLYSTHSSTEESPRVRILCPLTREVDSEEFEALSRYVAQSVGMDYFDECSYLPNQLMYWPSMPSDGAFLYKEGTGPWLDPDKLLSQHPTWKDPTTLPVSSREQKKHTTARRKVQDPLEKEGLIGAFNRTYYPITRALEAFLSEVYEPTSYDNRWHYIPSSSMAGVEIIEDKFVYSHHAKDPAFCLLCNAFDLVRVHRFSELDEKESFKAMSQFALEQEEVKELLLKEKQEEAQRDFGLEVKEEENPDWKRQLRYMKRSKCLENSVWNLLLILRNDPAFKNVAYNEFADSVEITGSVPWERPLGNSFWRDADMAQLKALIDIRYETFSDRNYQVAYKKVTEDRHFHPVRKWLDSLPKWDGLKRLETLFIDYLGAQDTPYVRAATRKPFVAAVSRVYHPGSKFDCIAVLVGPQGCGKSTMIARMGKKYYSDSLNLFDMKDKAGAEKLQGYWILEIGELAGMKKADIELVKAFVSRTDDKYRPAYGRTVESHPRQCVIFGTTNALSGFLRDITGNRRFWPINVSGNSIKKPWDLSEEEIQQIWAEAKELYEQGEPLVLNEEEETEAVAEQLAAMESDDRLGEVEEYLDKLIPENWYKLDTDDRKYFMHGDDELSPKGTAKRQFVTNSEIWYEIFEKPKGSLDRRSSDALVSMMLKSKLWKWTGKIRKVYPYGPQKYYVRNSSEEGKPEGN